MNGQPHAETAALASRLPACPEPRADPPCATAEEIQDANIIEHLEACLGWLANLEGELSHLWSWSGAKEYHERLDNTDSLLEKIRGRIEGWRGEAEE